MHRPLMLAAAALVGGACLVPTAGQAQTDGRLTISDRARTPVSPADAGQSSMRGPAVEPVSGTTSRVPSVGDVGQATVTLPGMARAPQGSLGAPLDIGDRPVAQFGGPSPLPSPFSRPTARSHSTAAAHQATTALTGMAPVSGRAAVEASGPIEAGDRPVASAVPSRAPQLPSRAAARTPSMADTGAATTVLPGIGARK